MKVVILGLDSAPPSLVFGQASRELPNLSSLMERGVFGCLESTIPAITIPAWTSMMSSKNPGRLGFFGFRNRKAYSYDEKIIANSRAVQEDRVWDLLSRAGKQVLVLGVPQTYPPSAVNGCLTSCFLTPDTNSTYTHPSDLRDEIQRVVGPYVLDVEDFRTEDKDLLLRQVYDFSEQHWRLLRHLMKTREWDFAMMVDMGPDRLQHGFWRFHDPEHRKYEPGNPYQSAIADYYRYLDEEIGRTLELLDENTAVFVVSDHGAKRMEGSFNINDWLEQEGYLIPGEKPEGLTRPEGAAVDWSRTTAWAWGGYYGRIFLNVKDRESQGVIAPSDYQGVREELREKLKSLRDDRGRLMATQVYAPEEVYSGPYVHRAPDLIVYLDDLYWRCTEDLGHEGLYSFDTEIGPDDAVHDQQGLFIMACPGSERATLEGLHVVDVAPTVLDLMGVAVPADMEGKIIHQRG